MNEIATMHEILDMVMEINEGCVARSGKGHPTAFFEYSGHINTCRVGIHFHGWDANYDYDDENEYLELPFSFGEYEDGGSRFSNYNLARLKGIVERIKAERKGE